MTFSPGVERQSLTAIQECQENGLQELIIYVAAKSPFYQKLFRQHNINPVDIKSLRDLTRIPATTKDDLQQNNWDFLCVDKSKIVEFTSTSGTLGKPVTIALTENDLNRLAYNEEVSFRCADGTDEDVYQLMLTLDRQFMAGMAYYQGIRRLGGAIVRVGPGLPAMQLETIQRLQPTILVAVPSFLVRLIEYAKSKDIDLNSLSVKRAICIGESIRRPDFAFNIIGQRIVESWNIQLYGTYASTEMQTAFTECSHGVGGHHRPDLIIVELLDEQQNPVPPNMPGEVTVTTLGVEGMPLLRYRTGDMAVAYYEPCPCGRNTLRLGPILGRKQQLIKFKGTTLYPPGIFEIMNEIDCVRDYVVEAFTSDLGTDEIRIYVTVEGPYQDDALKTLTAAFQSRLRVVPQINVVADESLEKMQHAPGARKVTRFIDRRG